MISKEQINKNIREGDRKNRILDRERFKETEYKLMCPCCYQEYSKENHVFKCMICFMEVCDYCQSKDIHKEICYMQPAYCYGFPEWP